MAKKKEVEQKCDKPYQMPADTPEAREKQIIAKAYTLAEQQIMDGTASSQVITHFLKRGSQKEQLEMEKLREENKLLRAKTADLESKKRQEEFYEQVLNAMRKYSGNGDEEDYNDDTNLF